MLRDAGADSDEVLQRLAEATLARPDVTQTVTGTIVTQVAGDLHGPVTVILGHPTQLGASQES